jgi:hypothetical protein
VLPQAEQQCAEDEEAYRDRIEAGATDGQHVLLLGVTAVVHAATGRCAFRSMAWVSSDGRTWQRSESFGADALICEQDLRVPPDDTWHLVPTVVGTVYIAEGPAGVLGIAAWPPASDRVGTVYRFVP